MPSREPHARRPAIPTRGSLSAATLALIRRPYVAEILAALDDRPYSIEGLHRATGAPYRLVVVALRALAVHHAVARSSVTGSWDTTGDRHLPYRLTTTGRELIDSLFRLDAWRDVYRPESRP